MLLSWWDDEVDGEHRVRTSNVEIDGQTVEAIRDEEYNRALDDVWEKLKPCQGCDACDGNIEDNYGRCMGDVVSLTYEQVEEIIDGLKR